MTAPELDNWLRGELALLEEQRPGAARLNPRDRWEKALAAFTAAVAAKTALSEAFLQELLERRDLVRQEATHSFEAWRLAADEGFVTAVMAAAAWSRAAATPRTRKG